MVWENCNPVPGTESPNLALAWCELGGKDALRVSGWTETELRELQGLDAGGLGRRLALLTSEALESGADARTIPPVAGRFEVDSHAVHFVPRFPFVAGIRYALVVNRPVSGGTGDDPGVLNILRPALESPPTASVVAIYPDVDEVPVNLLKFYVEFSEPMSIGFATRGVRVCRDDTGEPIDGVFVPMDPELWDSTRQRLTMLLDPARIKHGLVPNMEVGYPLIEGVPFRLFIDTEFRDARGRPLLTRGERQYNVGPEVRQRIDPRKWRLGVPAAGSREPLVVEFERPLDFALLQRCFRVKGQQGTAVEGSGRSGRGEGSWIFEPVLPWAGGAHQLVVERQLEDLAGNSPVRVFDRDMTEPDDGPTVEDRLAVDFTCVGG